jgi:hypothetical protein
MTRNKAEEIIRQVENLTVGDLVSLPLYECFAYEQQLQEVAATHRDTHLANVANDIINIIGGRY